VGIVKELVQRADSWVNAMTGLGTLRDKLMHAQVVPGAKLQDHTLEALFNDDDVARRVVAKLPREATRRGFKLVLEGDDEGEEDEDESADVVRQMDEAIKNLGALPKLRDGWIWARLYGGGSGIFVGADDGLPVDQPLNEESIRSIRFLNLVKRPQLSVKTRYEDVLAPKFGEPEIYMVNQAAAAMVPRNGLEVHESRLILFDGALTARMTMDSPTGFDDSVLQNAMAALQQTATAWQSVAHLLTDASQGVLKIANLVELVAADGQEVLRTRVQLMDLARSVCRSILIDAEKESFERVATSFAGLPEMMDKLMMRMSAASEQPVTLLYGRSAAGMNATGESDIRGWYDTVAEAQTDELLPRLERLLRLMFLAKDGPTRGRLPEQWSLEFCPLWQPTDKELADTKKTKADTYVALVGAQIMTDAEAGLGLATDFPTIDVEAREELAEADAEEGLRPREVNTPPVLEPDAGGGGGSKGKGPKARSDSDDREDAQARVPAGSPRGGQWTSTGGGGGGGAVQGPLGSGTLTEAQRQGIRASAASGKSSATRALQAKLVARYGVPLAKASLMYERDIKAQMKAAKERRGAIRASERAAKGAVDEALAKATGAMSKAVAAKRAGDAAKATDAATKAAAAAAKAAAKREATNAKSRATRAANKAKREAEATAAKAADEAAKAKAATTTTTTAKGTAGAKPGSHPDVDAHTVALKAKYGVAARTVAWGRAMHDRGRALTVEELYDGADALEAAGVKDFTLRFNSAARIAIQDHKPTNVAELAAGLRKNKVPKTAARVEAIAALVVHRRALEADGVLRTEEIKLRHTKYTTKAAYSGKQVEEDIAGAKARYQALSHKDLRQPVTHLFVADATTRANQEDQATFGRDVINVGAGKIHADPQWMQKAIVHEWGHALESNNANLRDRAHAYYEGRTRGQTAQQMPNHDPGERAKKGDPPFGGSGYAGKDYVHHNGKRYGTEITSVGVQGLRSGMHWGDEYQEDRELVHFALGQLANQ
jgi:uncharacterized protein